MGQRDALLLLTLFKSRNPILGLINVKWPTSGTTVPIASTWDKGWSGKEVLARYYNSLGPGASKPLFWLVVASLIVQNGQVDSVSSIRRSPPAHFGLSNAIINELTKNIKLTSASFYYVPQSFDPAAQKTESPYLLLTLPIPAGWWPLGKWVPTVSGWKDKEAFQYGSKAKQHHCWSLRHCSKYIT